MLAEGGWKPFDDPNWWFEPKFDGIRSVTTMATDSTRLVTRNGRDVTDKYPELRMIHELVDQVNAVLDAEIVAFDDDGKNSFEALQQRMNLTNEREIKRISSKIPVALVAFDLLWLDGNDLTELALEQRRELLETIVEQDHRLQVVTHVEGDGKDSPRRPGARPRGRGGQAARLEVPAGPALAGLAEDQAHEHAGLRDPRVDARARAAGRGRSARCSSGAYDDGELLWIGQVGTGFTRADPRPGPRGARAAEAADAADRRPRAREGQGRHVRRAEGRLRGRVPRDHEEHEEDARAVVQGAARRQDSPTNASSSPRA